MACWWWRLQSINRVGRVLVFMFLLVFLFMLWLMLMLMFFRAISVPCLSVLANSSSFDDDEFVDH